MIPVSKKTSSYMKFPEVTKFTPSQSLLEVFRTSSRHYRSAETGNFHGPDHVII